MTSDTSWFMVDLVRAGLISAETPIMPRFIPKGINRINDSPGGGNAAQTGDRHLRTPAGCRCIELRWNGSQARGSAYSTGNAKGETVYFSLVLTSMISMS